jgi:NADPH2:quinone reductase
MKAAAVGRFGPPSALKPHTLPVPEPGRGEILVAVAAAGVGSWDAEIRKGSWSPSRPRFPLVLGTDGSGTVAAKGPGVRRFELGERVYAYQYENPKGGFYAEYVAVEADRAAPVPSRLDMLEAGALPTTGLTALQGIEDALQVRRGETVLVFGATGAVGTLAVQFARARGARVIATASSRAGAGLLRKLGAAAVFDARTGADRLPTLAPGGLDAALVLASGDTLEQCLKLVRPGGRVAYPNGVEPEPRRRPKVRLVAYDGEASQRAYARLARAVEQAKLRIPIAAVFSLAQAARAHQRLEKGGVMGRIVLRVRRETGSPGIARAAKER